MSMLFEILAGEPPYTSPLGQADQPEAVTVVREAAAPPGLAAEC